MRPGFRLRSSWLRMVPLATAPHRPSVGQGQPKEAVVLNFGTTAGPWDPQCQCRVEAKPYQACLLLVQTFIELLLNA